MDILQNKFNEDTWNAYYEGKIEPFAIQLSLVMSNMSLTPQKLADLSDVIMQYDHTGRVYARNSNNTLKLTADTKGLLIAADLSKTELARGLYEDISAGMITKMSWAFTVAEDSYDRVTHTRTILKIKKVYDVSAVSAPANDGTSIAARSYASGRREAEQRETLEKRAAMLRILATI